MVRFWKYIIAINIILSSCHPTTAQSTKGKDENTRQDRTYLIRNKKECQNAYKHLTGKQIARLRDASGKQGSGIYGGNTLWYGSYSECQKLPSTRYCLTLFSGVLSLALNETQVLDFQWGVCMPDICTKEDVSNDLTFFLNKISGIDVNPLPKPLRVECAEEPEYTTSVVITIVFCGFLIAVCLLATIVEIISDSLKHSETEEIVKEDGHIEMTRKLEEYTPLNSDKKETTNDAMGGSLLKILNCFSCQRNIKFIMNTDVGKSDLTYLHGIRVLSLFWIILFHIYGLALQPSVENVKDSVKLLQRFTFLGISQGAYGVDTFFILSGLLLMYVHLKKEERNSGQTNWFKFYIHRFWRLTPTVMFFILLVAKLLPFCGAGPVWYVQRKDTSCSDFWWTNVLYINNFVNSGHDELCIAPTWYLSADMQLFIISPIFLLIARRYKFRPLVCVIGFVILASVITTASLIGVKNLNPLLNRGAVSTEPLLEEYDNFFKNVYVKPYCRIPPYVMGMALGYVIYSYFSREFKLKWNIILLFWILAVSVALADVYGPYSALKEDPRVWTKGENVVFGSLRWSVWSLCVVWLIFACHYNYAGPVKTILAAKFWIPLSRINYAAYIVHYTVIKVLAYNIEVPIHYTAFTTVTNFLSTLVLCYALAFILAIFVELPCANLESLFWKRIEKK